MLKQIIKAIVPFGLLYLYRNKGAIIRRLRYLGYKPYGYGESLGEFVNWIKANAKIEVKNIFEIGANFAQDADYLAGRFNIKPENVYVFEAHPELYKAIIKLHRFNAYHCAVFNEEKDINFNIVPMDSSNSGVSSIFQVKHDLASKKSITSIRMDKFMNENNIVAIDFLKLDVEGASYEVLEGFGDRIRDIKVLHVEAEHSSCPWILGTTKYFDDIAALLNRNGFEMIYFKRITWKAL